MAHGVHLRLDECERLARASATLAVNASSNLRLASGIAPGESISAAGLRFGLGLDGLALADDEDMLAEIRLGSVLLGGWGHGRSGPGPAECLAAATSWGWRAIDGTEGQGLAEGAPADILLLDEDELMPDRLDEDHLPGLILGRMHRGAVTEVIARGRHIVRAERLSGIDLPALEQELLRQARLAQPNPRLLRLIELAERASVASILQGNGTLASAGRG